MIPYKQLSLADIFTDCQDKFETDKPAFLSLLQQHIDMDKIIPIALQITFRNHVFCKALLDKAAKYSWGYILKPQFLQYCLNVHCNIVRFDFATIINFKKIFHLS